MTYRQRKPLDRPYTIRKGVNGKWVLTVRGGMMEGASQYTLDTWLLAMRTAREVYWSREREYMSAARHFHSMARMHTGVSRDLS